MTDKIDSDKLQYKLKKGDLTSTEKKELETNKKIKPILRKYLIDSQVKKAGETAKEEKKEKKEMLASTDIIERAKNVSMKALLELKLWEKFPPTIEMAWTKTGASTEEQVKDMNIDISGFAYYLVREYRNYLKLRNAKMGYRNPMDIEHIEFFWIKCQQDLKLLLEADRRRKMAGNAGVILLDKKLSN